MNIGDKVVITRNISAEVPSGTKGIIYDIDEDDSVYYSYTIKAEGLPPTVFPFVAATSKEIKLIP